MISKIKELIDKGKDRAGRINYSTSEQVIGKWVNGKPLYQLTLDVKDALLPGKGSSGQITFNYNFSGLKIDTIVDSNILVKGVGSNQNSFLSLGGVWALIQLSKNNILIGQDYTYTYNVFAVSYFTFQYTKTTD